MRRLVPALTALVSLMCTMGLAADGPIKIDGLTVEGWQKTSGPQTWIGDAVEEKIDGFVDFHKGFNLIDTQWLLLEKDGAKLDVFVFTYDTPENAFGLHSVMRRTIMQAGGAEAVELGDEAAFHPMGQLLVWAGRCNVIVTKATMETPPKEAFLAAAEPLVAQIAGKSEKPELVQALPTDNLDERSVIYCHYRQALDQVFYVGEENVLGLGDDLNVPSPVEAIFGVYTLENRPHQLIVIRYPEASAAASAAQRFGEIRAADAKTDTTDGAWRDFEARNGKHTLVYQAGKLLAIAPDGVAVDAMKQIVSSVDQTLNAEAAIVPLAPPTWGG